MRTTLTIDDDIADILQRNAHQRGHSFKEVVNDLLRAGLAASGSSIPERRSHKVTGRPLGLKAGYDTDKMNQLVDELEVDEFLRKERAK